MFHYSRKVPKFFFIFLFYQKTQTFRFIEHQDRNLNFFNPKIQENTPGKNPKLKKTLIFIYKEKIRNLKIVTEKNIKNFYLFFIFSE